MLRTGVRRAGKPSAFRTFSSSCCRRQEPPFPTNRPAVDATSREKETKPPNDDVIFSSPPSENASSKSHSSHSVVDVPNATSKPAESKPPSNSQPPVDLEALKERMREWTAVTTSIVRQRTDELSTKAKATFAELGPQLNRVTGYEEIEALKKTVVDQGIVVLLCMVIVKVNMTLRPRG